VYQARDLDQRARPDTESDRICQNSTAAMLSCDGSACQERGSTPFPDASLTLRRVIPII
jgi:hypothetical protein